MPTSPAALALWGKLLLHNKVLTQEQWDDAQAALQHAGADATIETVLISQNLLSKSNAEKVGSRVTQLLGKIQSPSPAPPAAPAVEAAPIAAANPAPAPAASDDDLMPADSPSARGRNSSDTEWVETTENTKAALEFKSKDIATIDLIESEPAEGAGDKKKIWTPTPGEWNKPMTGPIAEGAGRSKNIPQIPLDGEE